jgi:hypothetical protein
MVSAKPCAFEHPDGRACGAPPLRTGRFCYWHEPGKGEEAADARRLGGLQRRRERTVAGAYDVAGLDTVDAIRRVLEIATIDALGLENSIARTRVLIAAALAAARLLEVNELETGGFALEAGL